MKPVVARRPGASHNDSSRSVKSEHTTVVHYNYLNKQSQIYNSYSDSNSTERDPSRIKSVRSPFANYPQPSSPQREIRENRDPRDVEELKLLRDQRNFFRNCALGLVELLGVRVQSA